MPQQFYGLTGIRQEPDYLSSILAMTPYLAAGKRQKENEEFNRFLLDLKNREIDVDEGGVKSDEDFNKLWLEWQEAQAIKDKADADAEEKARAQERMDEQTAGQTANWVSGAGLGLGLGELLYETGALGALGNLLGIGGETAASIAPIVGAAPTAPALPNPQPLTPEGAPAPPASSTPVPPPTESAPVNIPRPPTEGFESLTPTQVEGFNAGLGPVTEAGALMPYSATPLLAPFETIAPGLSALETAPASLAPTLANIGNVAPGITLAETLGTLPGTGATLAATEIPGTLAGTGGVMGTGLLGGATLAESLAAPASGALAGTLGLDTLAPVLGSILGASPLLMAPVIIGQVIDMLEGGDGSAPVPYSHADIQRMIDEASQYYGTVNPTELAAMAGSLGMTAPGAAPTYESWQGMSDFGQYGQQVGGINPLTGEVLPARTAQGAAEGGWGTW
ncbi:MAG: hypothetical protein V2B18_13485, partial [Pseudomonadota bacterium]